MQNLTSCYHLQISVTDSPNVNCDPSYQASTINAIPATEALLKKSKLPFALVLAPYRSLKEGDVSCYYFITLYYTNKN